MTPEQLAEIKDDVERLDTEYWNGTDRSVTDAINDLADLTESVRTAWMNGRAP